MRPTSPSNRVSTYYQAIEAHNAYASSATNHSAIWASRQQAACQRRRSGRVAGMAASVLQLAISSLCVAAALSMWLGYPIGISPTTAVFLGGMMFGMVSLLQLYSAIANVSNDTARMAYDD
jgi:hypothetical protein